MKVIVHVDGGARGNPGPAAAACVISSADGELIGEHAELLGRATNNVAEYRALLLGLERARELGVTDVEVIGDSELIAKQVRGIYKVKHDVGQWDEYEDVPDESLAQAALRMAELLATRPEGTPFTRLQSIVAASQDPTYLRLIKGHRRRFSVA